MLLDCPVLQNVREDILKTALLDRNITMENLIEESGAIRSVLTYLWEIEIFDIQTIPNFKLERPLL